MQAFNKPGMVREFSKMVYGQQVPILHFLVKDSKDVHYREIFTRTIGVPLSWARNNEARIAY